ncbi:hypothetical protein vseg_001129 [Gypsophila vaccaria]
MMNSQGHSKNDFATRCTVFHHGTFGNSLSLVLTVHIRPFPFPHQAEPLNRQEGPNLMVKGRAEPTTRPRHTKSKM